MGQRARLTRPFGTIMALCLDDGALGVEPTVEVEVQEIEVEKGDYLLLCSDGLPDMIEDEEETGLSRISE